MTESTPTPAPQPPNMPPNNEIDPELQKYQEAYKIMKTVKGEDQFHTVVLRLDYLLETFCPDVDESLIQSLIQTAEDADSRLEWYQMTDGEKQQLTEETRLKFQDVLDSTKEQLKSHGIDYDILKRAKQSRQDEASKINREFNSDLYT